jgi:hypothetical protein
MPAKRPGSRGSAASPWIEDWDQRCGGSEPFMVCSWDEQQGARRKDRLFRQHLGHLEFRGDSTVPPVTWRLSCSGHPRWVGATSCPGKAVYDHLQPDCPPDEVEACGGTFTVHISVGVPARKFVWVPDAPSRIFRSVLERELGKYIPPFFPSPSQITRVFCAPLFPQRALD